MSLDLSTFSLIDDAFRGRVHALAPDVVFAAQCDPHYVVWKHEHMAAFDVSAAVPTLPTTTPAA